MLPNAAKKQLPLQQLLGPCDKKKNTIITWTDEAIASYEGTKRMLHDETMLAHPVPGAQLAIMTDACDIGIGASVQQLVVDAWQPLGFFSRKLSDTERKYRAYDRELLAIFAAIKHFRAGGIELQDFHRSSTNRICVFTKRRVVVVVVNWTSLVNSQWIYST